MSLTKRYWEELQSRGYGPTDRAVCARCFDDYAIQEFISTHTSEPECSFCEQQNPGENIAADGEAVLAFILRGLWSEYSDVDTEAVPYDSEDDRYIVPTYSNYELFHEQLPEITQNGEVRDWLVSTMHDRLWCEKDPAILSPTEGLVAGWRDFCDEVKYGTRFLFFDERPEKDPGEPREVGEEPYYVYPTELLQELSKVVRQLDLIVPVANGTELFRVRPHEAQVRLVSPADLGPPQPKQATAGRMNAAGIVVFYGALDVDTARAEKEGDDPAISVGTFQLTREARLLDLTNVPSTPSIFDIQRAELRVPIRFIRQFRDDIVKPVTPDRIEHLEYVPTQVVTEFIRLRFTDQQGRRVDGMMYPSSKRREGRNVVLFATQDNVEEISTQRLIESPKLLRLTTAETIVK